MRLFLDLGNTRLKWVLAEAGVDHWVAQGALGWGELALLAAAWTELPRPTAIIAASVVDTEREQTIEGVTRQLFDRTPRWLRTPAVACGVVNAYAEPARLGVDRFLSMVAAHAAGDGPCVLVGVGTALTLDALTSDGRHLGGVIAPSPRLMQQSLLIATARVRPERPGVVLELADNTADAVSSGCWLAAVALVERFSHRMADQMAGKLKIILSGGDAAALLSMLSFPGHLRHDSVLRGLVICADASAQVGLTRQ